MMARRKKTQEKYRSPRPDPHSADWVTFKLLCDAGVPADKARLDFDEHRRCAMLIAFRCPSYNRRAWEAYQAMTQIERLRAHTRMNPNRFYHVFETPDEEANYGEPDTDC